MLLEACSDARNCIRERGIFKRNHERAEQANFYKKLLQMERLPEVRLTIAPDVML
jgi:hypothetical protein